MSALIIHAQYRIQYVKILLEIIPVNVLRMVSMVLETQDVMV